MDSIGFICPGDVGVGKMVEVELIRELMSGKDYATQLLTIVQRPLREDDGSLQLALEIVEKIKKSIDSGLRLAGSSDVVGLGEGNFLNNCDAGHRQVPVFSSDNGVEGSDDSSGTKKRAGVLMGRRGCYKRRKSCQTRVTVLPTIEDGQAWRKYGQKVILNAKFPRSYFRCTHKYDRHCKASKQVQMMEDKPGMYHTTYIGTHTCNRNPVELSELIIPGNLDQGANNFNISFTDEHVKDEIKLDQGDAKSDLTDNISFSSVPNNSSSPKQPDNMVSFGFEFTSSDHDEDQGDISKMYGLDMDDNIGSFWSEYFDERDLYQSK